MPNMENIISQHNKSILSETEPEESRTCNCRTQVCPMNGHCLAEDIIYQAEVVTDDDKKKYLGSCSTTFKLRYANHKASFAKMGKRNDTELASYIWSLKEKGKNFSLLWKIVAKANSYYKGYKNCKLCLNEKMLILKSDKNVFLNKRELMTKCHHKGKFKMKAKPP